MRNGELKGKWKLDANLVIDSKRGLLTNLTKAILKKLECIGI